jgi:tetratricopeptide (TPR) repeat protein
MMKRIVLIASLFLSASAVAAVGQTEGISDVRKEQAKREINEGARLYREREYFQAQLHFEQALALDPILKNARLFIARAIHSQYHLGVDSPENVATAREAIAAYERALDFEPQNDDAYNAIVLLYNAIKDNDMEHLWLTRRAEDEQVAAGKRSMAYTVLASQEWQCSYNVTDRSENKQAVIKGDRAIVTYVMPKDGAEFARARACAVRGLELSEKAVSLDPQSEQAWSFKTNILLELVKLAKMEGRQERAAELQRQASEAQQRMSALNEQNKKKEVEEQERKGESQHPPE